MKERRFLPEPEAHAVLRAYGFPMLHSRMVRDEAEAVRAAQEIGFPVVMKIVSPDIVHKVDVGGVRLNLQIGSRREECLCGSDPAGQSS